MNTEITPDVRSIKTVLRIRLRGTAWKVVALLHSFENCVPSRFKRSKWMNNTNTGRWVFHKILNLVLCLIKESTSDMTVQLNSIMFWVYFECEIKGFSATGKGMPVNVNSKLQSVPRLPIIMWVSLQVSSLFRFCGRLIREVDGIPRVSVQFKYIFEHRITKFELTHSCPLSRDTTLIACGNLVEIWFMYLCNKTSTQYSEKSAVPWKVK